MSVSVFGSDPKGLVGFSETGSGDEFRITEHIGKLAQFVVAGPEQVQTAEYGVKTAIKCPTVRVQDGDKVVTYTDVLIFNAAPVSQLGGWAGREVVAKVIEYETGRKGQGGKPQVAPKLEAPSDAELSAFEAALSA